MDVKKLIQKQGALVGLLVIIVALAILSPNFLTMDNLMNVFRQVSINALIAFGMTFVILTGGIDLSVGSILALSSALTAGFMVGGMNSILAMFQGILLGALMGAANGVAVAKGKIAPFIVTLATMTIFRGLTLVYTEGKPITGISDSFAFQLVGRGYFFGIPFPVVIR